MTPMNGNSTFGWPQVTGVPFGHAQQTFHLGGWICAGCGRGYSPAVPQCGWCGPAQAGSETSWPASPAALPAGTHACPRPADGGMCGCDEDDDSPKVCLSRECDC